MLVSGVVAASGVAAPLSASGAAGVLSPVPFVARPPEPPVVAPPVASWSEPPLSSEGPPAGGWLEHSAAIQARIPTSGRARANVTIRDCDPGASLVILLREWSPLPLRV